MGLYKREEAQTVSILEREADVYSIHSQVDKALDTDAVERT